MSNNTYIGPYLLIDDPNETYDHKVNTWGCSNPECTHRANTQLGNFCSICGSKLGNISETVKCKKSWTYVFDELGCTDTVHQVLSYIKGPCVFISNFKNEHINLSEGDIVPIEDMFNEDFALAFRKRSQACIDYAEKHGLSYEFKYGVVNYYD